MPKDFIASRLKAFRVQSKSDQQALEEYCKESPFERTKREVRENLARSEKYRASVLRNVTTFGKFFAIRFFSMFVIYCYIIVVLSTAGLNPEAIIAAAQSMEEVFYKKGDIVIQQDDIGDSFYVLEEGIVSVTVRFEVLVYIFSTHSVYHFLHYREKQI
ncbi:hypothetical protein EON65_04885 [archaeon]|nr:MAG: hypothetical protein EON65_04885 [archaeon]